MDCHHLPSFVAPQKGERGGGGGGGGKGVGTGISASRTTCPGLRRAEREKKGERGKNRKRHPPSNFSSVDLWGGEKKKKKGKGRGARVLFCPPFQPQREKKEKHRPSRPRTRSIEKEEKEEEKGGVFYERPRLSGLRPGAEEGNGRRERGPLVFRVPFFFANPQEEREKGGEVGGSAYDLSPRSLNSSHQKKKKRRVVTMKTTTCFSST